MVDGVVAPLTEGGDKLGYFLFDLPYLDGHDLTRVPLEQRKALLEELVRRAGQGSIRYVEHIAGGGADFYREACRLGIGAMVSRKAASRYDAKAGWVTVKCATAKGEDGKTKTPHPDPLPAVAGRGKRRDPQPPPLPKEFRLTHPERVLWPDVAGGFTKLQLVRYYQAVAELVLPHMAGRPLSLFRCPNGMPADPKAKPACFFMKHPGLMTPRSLEKHRILERSKPADYMVARDLAGVLELAQMSILEIHPWNALRRRDRISRPRDLRPGSRPGGAVGARRRGRVRDPPAPRRLRPRQRRQDDGRQGTAHRDAVLGAEPRVVGRRLRVLAGSVRAAGRASSRRATSRRCRRRSAPGRSSSTTSGITAAAPRSQRIRPAPGPGATVSVPLAWDELTPALDPRAFTVETVPARAAGAEGGPVGGDDRRQAAADGQGPARRREVSRRGRSPQRRGDRESKRQAIADAVAAAVLRAAQRGLGGGDDGRRVAAAGPASATPTLTVRKAASRPPGISNGAPATRLARCCAKASACSADAAQRTIAEPVAVVTREGVVRAPGWRPCAAPASQHGIAGGAPPAPVDPGDAVRGDDQDRQPALLAFRLLQPAPSRSSR